MLNRAPTLHRLGIQAFEPILSKARRSSCILWFVLRSNATSTVTRWPCTFRFPRSAGGVPLHAAVSQQPAQAFRRRTGGRAFSGHGAGNLLPDTGKAPDRRAKARRSKASTEADLAYENKACTLHSRIKVRMTKVNAREKKCPASWNPLSDVSSSIEILRRIWDTWIGAIRRIPEAGSGFSRRQKAAEADSGEGYQHPRRIQDCGSAGRREIHRL